MNKTLAAILAFVLVSLGAVTLFTYEPEPAPTRYYCPADGHAFAADNMSFYCGPGVIGYDVQQHDGIYYYTTTTIYADA